MYSNYIIYELDGIEYDNRRQIASIAFILLPVINILINTIFVKEDSKAIKYYIKSFFISIIIGIGYYLVYILSIIFT